MVPENLLDSQKILELIPDYIVQVDSQGVIKNISKVLAGLKKEEVIGKSIYDFIDKDFQKLAKDALKLAKKTNEIQKYEYTIHHQGIRTWWLNRVIPYSQNKKTDTFLIIGTEISQLKSIELEHRKSEERFHSFFHDIGLAMVITDKKGGFLQVNKTFCDLLGYKESELLGMKVLDITHPKDIIDTKKFFEKVRMQKLKFLRIEKRYVRKDKSVLWGEVYSSWFLDEKGDPLYSVTLIVDITHRKDYEVNAQARYERAKLQRDSILKIVTHDKVTSGDMKKALRFITRTTSRVLNVDRVGVWLLSDDGKSLRCAQQYLGTKKQDTSGLVLLACDYPNYFNALKTGRAIDANDAQVDKRTKEFAKEYLKPLKISSMLDAAIRISGNVVGIVCHEHVGEKREWQDDEMAFAGEVADQVAQVILNHEKTLAHEKLEDAFETMEKRVKERTKELTEENIVRKKAEEALEKKNYALKEVLEQIEIEKKQIKENIAANIEELLLPAIKKMKRKGRVVTASHIELLEKSLKGLSSKFGSNIVNKNFQLSPREIEISNMIKNGLSSKEISEMLAVAPRTIEIHRTNIRKKLNISGKDVNLTTFLKNMS